MQPGPEEATDAQTYQTFPSKSSKPVSGAPGVTHGRCTESTCPLHDLEEAPSPPPLGTAELPPRSLQPWDSGPGLVGLGKDSETMTGGSPSCSPRCTAHSGCPGNRCEDNVCVRETVGLTDGLAEGPRGAIPWLFGAARPHWAVSPGNIGTARCPSKETQASPTFLLHHSCTHRRITARNKGEFSRKVQKPTPLCK